MSKVNLDNIVESVRRKSSTVISVDVDNTIIYLPIISYINNKFNKNYTDNDFTHWNISCFPEEIAEDVRYQFKNPDFMRRTRAFQWAYPTLRDWHASGARIFAITRRAPNLIRMTYDQLDREVPGVLEDVLFVNDDESKVKYLKRLGASIHIDDWDVEDSSRAGINTWLITNEQTHYNWNLRTNTNISSALELKYVKVNDKKWR